MPAYSRRMSSIERFALAINELYRYNVIVMIEGEGALTRQALQSAVDLAAAENPGARVRLKGFLGISEWVDSGIAPEVMEIQAPDWDGFSERGADFMEGRFHPLDGGPVCDLFLVKGASKTRIVARVVHAAMDARGLQHFVEDVFRILRGEPPVGSTSTLTNTDITSKFQDRIKATRKAMNCIPILPPSNHDVSDIRYVWRRMTLDRNIKNLLPKVAVFLAQYARRDSVGEVGFTVPVDLRGLREEVSSTGNLISMLHIKVDPEDNAMTVMKQINQNIRDYADCIIPGLMKWFRWVPLSFIINDMRRNSEMLLFHTTRALSSSGIVSMGLINPADFSCPQFRATSCVGVPASVGKMGVVIMNYRDHTEVAFSTPGAYNQDGQLDRMIGEFSAFIMDTADRATPDKGN